MWVNMKGPNLKFGFFKFYVPRIQVPGSPVAEPLHLSKVGTRKSWKIL